MVSSLLALLVFQPDPAAGLLERFGSLQHRGPQPLLAHRPHHPLDHAGRARRAPEDRQVGIRERAVDGAAPQHAQPGLLQQALQPSRL